MTSKQRVTNDSVHGHYYLENICWTIIDTPPFQRLRDIKQLGTCYLIFPGAVHSRFEHSLGTAYLCRKLMLALSLNHPEAAITKKEILLITIAGLCHDLGHCAFSHLFEHIAKEIGFDKFKPHEHMSYFILEHIFENYIGFSWGINREDLKFIGQIIFGSADKAPAGWNWIHSPPSRRFLYSIVSNSETGIDLDKFDYILRDCKYAGVSCAFDPRRMIEFAHLDNKDGSYVLTYDKKMEEDIRSMWQSREDLHRRVYKHRVVHIFNNMITQILKSAAPYLFIGSVHFKDIFNDIDAYCHVTDHIITIIEIKTDPEFREARDIISDMKMRRLEKYR